MPSVSEMWGPRITTRSSFVGPSVTIIEKSLLKDAQVRQRCVASGQSVSGCVLAPLGLGTHLGLFVASRQWT